MRLLSINSVLLVYLMLLLLLGISNEVYGLLVTMSEQVAKEGDDEVVIPCDYSQVTSTPHISKWNELNEAGVITTNGIVNNIKTLNGRLSLNITAGKADLVISKPVRNDSQRRFQCEIQTPSGDFTSSDHPSILTVYYLDEPVLSASADSVYEGESVILTCSKPDGDPVPNISWYKDGQALSTTDTTRFDTSEDALLIHITIKTATAIDGGTYTCKAESDQFKGEDGKTSNQIDLKVIYLSVTFELEVDIAACTAEGHPEPSSVIIYKDGKMIEEGEVTASVMINEDICQSNITCYAENGEVNGTESLKTCNTDVLVQTASPAEEDSLNTTATITSIVVVICLIAGVVLAYYECCCYVKRRERKKQGATADKDEESPLNDGPAPVNDDQDKATATAVCFTKIPAEGNQEGRSTEAAVHPTPTQVVQDNQADRVIKNYLTAWQKKMYQDVNRMTPATWNKDYEIDIAQVFTDLELLKSRREDCGEREAKPSTLAEVLDVIKSTDACKVLITGKGGMGKTTLLRYIAYNWVTDGDNTFAGKLLFLINIRDIKVDKNVLDAIVQQIKLEDFSLKTDLPGDPRTIKKFVKKHNDEIVLLLDGLDELEPGAESPISLFKRHELVKSTVILTSRPENTAYFDESCDVHVIVKGFSPSNIKQYIHKHFKFIRRHELGESLTQEFMLDSESKWHYGGKHKEAFELCSSPFLLLRICTMWKDKQYLPTDVSELFKEFTCCILNQYINKSDKGKAISHFDNIPKNYESAILALGKCMYEGLQKNILSIDKDVLRGEYINDEETVNQALKVGFVYQDKSANEDDFREIYTPPHKLISESLAGLYLCKQSQQGFLRSDECEMIRSNEYLHMIRVFTIGFLGPDAGKLLKHWLKNRASNYYSLAKYFKYVKKEHEEPVLQELNEHMSTEMKAHCEQMCESFRNVLCIDDDVHLIQLMRQCCVKYEGNPGSLEKNMLTMIKKSAELSINDVCAILVDILIIVGGLYADQYYRHGPYSVIEYLANWKDKEIDILSAKMKNLQFKYSFEEFKSYGMEKLSPKVLIHLLKTASELTILELDSCVTGVVLNQVFIELLESQVSLKLRKLYLGLSDVKGVSLANLHKLAPKMKVLNMSECELSGTIINTMITECQSQTLVLELNELNINFNDLSDVNGVSLANLLKIAPKLKELCMNSCKLSGTIINTMVKECQSCQVVLELNELYINFNDLSDVNGVSLANLLKIAPRLKELCMNSCKLSGTIINTMVRECQSCQVVLELNKLDIINNVLSDVNGVSLANLLKIAPKLKELYMSECKLSDTIVNSMVTECQSQKLGLELIILDINQFPSDTSEVSFAKFHQIFPKLLF